jgi:hypothetical protein
MAVPALNFHGAQGDWIIHNHLQTRNLRKIKVQYKNERNELADSSNYRQELPWSGRSCAWVIAQVHPYKGAGAAKG